MSYDPADDYLEYEQEAYVESLYKEFLDEPDNYPDFIERVYDEVVANFAESRLQSYYIQHPDVATLSRTALTQARGLLGHSPTAAQVFGAIAAEVGVRTTLLLPIVHGLVHADSAAGRIAQLTITVKDDKILKILLDLLAEYGGVDLREHRRPGSSSALWEEMVEVRNKRNRVVHRADMATEEEANRAISVAAEIVEAVFEEVVDNLGLRIEGGKVVPLG